jgi:hypothetical protein
MKNRVIITQLIIVLVLGLFSVANANRQVALPFEENFNNQLWLNDLALRECGGAVTSVTSGCYDGACVKVTPPTSPCTGGGTNGGQTGLGWITYPGNSRVHVQFLIFFGNRFAANVANGGGGLINKFLLQDAPSRSGILGLNGSDTSGRYLAWGVLNAGESYVFKSPPNRGWIEDATFRISSTQNSQEWICVEYWIDTNARQTGLYVWTRNGLQEQISGVTAEAGISQQGFYISYFNCYGIAHADNFYLMDNLRISNRYMGPPTGFLNSGSTVQTPNNLVIISTGQQ